MLDANFPVYSPGSRRWIDFAERDELDQLTAEARRTLEAAAASAPARQARGSLTREEADRIGFVWLAIVEDLSQGPDNLSDEMECAHLRRFKVAANGVRWEAKVTALRGEIALRRSAYPGLVDKGQLTCDQARQQLERLEAVHDLYWRHGFAFDGTRDELRELLGTVDAAEVQSCGDSSRVEHSDNHPTVAGSNPAPRSTAGAAA
jgi:hypothetical protein